MSRCYRLGENISDCRRVTIQQNAHGKGELYEVQKSGTFLDVTVGVQPNSSGNASYGTQIRQDSHGNIFVMGSFSGTLNLGFGNNSVTLNTNLAAAIFIAKYDPNFALLKVAQIFNYYDYQCSFCLDCQGNVYVSGNMTGAWGSPNAFFSISSKLDDFLQVPFLDGTYNDGFLAKYSNDLCLLSKTPVNVGAIGGNGDVIFTFNECLKKDIFMTGFYAQSMVLKNDDGQLIMTTKQDPSYYPSFLVKYKAKENPIFDLVAEIGITDYYSAVSNLAVTSCYDNKKEEKMFSYGQFTGTLNFYPALSVRDQTNNYTPQQLQETRTLFAPPHYFNAFLARYNKNMCIERLAQTITVYLPSSSPFVPLDIVSASIDNCGTWMYITGNFTGTIIFSDKVSFHSAFGATYIAKYNCKTLKFKKANIIQTNNYINPNSIFFKNDHVYLGGSFLGMSTFSSTITLQTLGTASNVFLAKYDACSLSCKWATMAGGFSTSGGDTCDSILVDSTGYLYSTGGLSSNPSTFGSIQPQANFNNQQDYFLSKSSAYSPRLKAKLSKCYSGSQNEKVFNPFEKNTEVVRVDGKLIPGVAYFSSSERPHVLIASSDCSCTVSNKKINGKCCCVNKVNYVGTATSKHCLLKTLCD